MDNGADSESISVEVLLLIFLNILEESLYLIIDLSDIQE